MKEFFKLYDFYEKGFVDIKFIWICNFVDFIVIIRDLIFSVVDNIEKENNFGIFEQNFRYN